MNPSGYTKVEDCIDKGDAVQGTETPVMRETETVKY